MISERIFDDITQTIGDTPLVRLRRLVPDGAAEVVLKLDWFNPGGSVKDRIGLSMVLEAERRGELRPGMTIIEPTSGNTGIGLALVAAARGYPLVIVMPETMSVERRKLLKALGATIHLTEGPKGIKAAIARAEELLKEHSDWWMPQQFDNPDNPKIHRETTAQEIIRDTAGQFDAFVAGVGTGGTIAGCGEVFKKILSRPIHMVAVEPVDSPVLSGGAPGPHKIQGIGAGFVPSIYRKEYVDEVIAVRLEDSIETTRSLARREGILNGISSGAIVWAAIEVAKKLGKGKRVVALIPSNGERYLSTVLFQDVNVEGGAGAVL
ncbi:MAG TPA: cysteine synthase A [Thermoanaerobaculia bacterium]|nr:cysteine synthase A [Thermoanaerobaculia bacterium]